MTGSQCDTCRKFELGNPPGWFLLQKVNDPAQAVNFVDMIGTFCSVKCLTEYSYVNLAVTVEKVNDTESG